jgi:pimeloyl-ACP methyl ester carboxylesterase
MAYVTSRGIRIHYETEGSGPALVLQHGLTDSIEGLRESGLVDALKASRLLILIDARGHGQSDKPRDPEAYTLPHRASDVIAVLDALGIATAEFYGYSMGGVIGFGVAAQAPHRLTSLVAGGAHPFASSMESLRLIFEAGLNSWLLQLEEMAGPLSGVAVERILSNDIEALRASVALDRQPAFPKTGALPFPCRLMVADGDPIFGLVRQTAMEFGAGFFPLRGYNHYSAYIRPLNQLPVITGDAFHHAKQSA